MRLTHLIFLTAGLLLGVIVTTAAKTLSVLAVPAAGLALAGVLLWKRHHRRKSP